MEVTPDKGVALDGKGALGGRVTQERFYDGLHRPIKENTRGRHSLAPLAFPLAG